MQYNLQSQSSTHSPRHRRVSPVLAQASQFGGRVKVRRTRRRVSMLHVGIMFFLLLAMLAMAGRPAFPAPTPGRPITVAAVDAATAATPGN